MERRGYDRRPAVALAGMRTFLMVDAVGLTLLVGIGIYLAVEGRIATDTSMVRGLQLVTLASLIGCVATADKAALQKRTMVIDLLGAGTWALAVVLTPVAMIQRLETAVALPMHFLMLLWLSLHGAVGVVLAGLALRWRGLRPLRRLFLWQRWLAMTGLVALAFPYLMHWAAM